MLLPPYAYSIIALCIGQILDVFLGSTINTGTPYIPSLIYYRIQLTLQCILIYPMPQLSIPIPSDHDPYIISSI